MANPKGSGKGGRKRIYGDLDEKERIRLSREKFLQGKRKMNFFVKEDTYQQFLRLEEEAGFKFHSDFLEELLDSYEKMMKIRSLVTKEVKEEREQEKEQVELGID